MVHGHDDTIINSSATFHRNDCISQSKACEYTSRKHTHHYILDLADPHLHSLTLSFGNAALGTPNWWEHTHPITLTVCAGAGARHTHGTTNPNSELDNCTLCVGYPHLHGKGNIAIANAGAFHTHTLPAGNTGNADPAGTPENHVHPFNVTLNDGGGHAHPYVVGQFSDFADCYHVANHRHAWMGTSTGYHNHTGSGDSGSGGESPVVPMRFQGDGLQWSVMPK